MGLLCFLKHLKGIPTLVETPLENPFSFFLNVFLHREVNSIEYRSVMTLYILSWPREGAQ
jgi:hypothetical protein